MANGPSKQTTNRDSWWIVGLALLAFLGYNNFCTGDEPPVTSRPRPTMASTTYPPPTEPTPSHDHYPPHHHHDQPTRV